MTLRQYLPVNILFVLIFVSLARTDDLKNARESIYTTCDFDVEGIEALLEYLPAICKEIYDKRQTDPELYNSYVDESKAFAKFYKKLDEYELGSAQGQQMELEKYPFNVELRRSIYTQVNWADCVVSANASASEYLNCVTDKRLKLEQLIPIAVLK